MRIILSRKGFDSSLGGLPSPVLPNGELVSLPIPEINSKKRRFPYSLLRFGQCTLDEILGRLSPGRTPIPEYAHLDPDIRKMLRIAILLGVRHSANPGRRKGT